MPSGSLRTSIVVVSDRVEHDGSPEKRRYDTPSFGPVDDKATPTVHGGYLERLPLAAVHYNLVDFAEIWHHSTNRSSFLHDGGHLASRVFPLTDTTAPFHSEAMLDFIRQHGAPRILCVWGLGVSEPLLQACSDSFIIYNSIDAPALRVPPQVSGHFDLVLTGAQWQSDEVEQRHPGMLTAVMPIGPEFASPETFFPIDAPKLYDVIYVGAAQPYKRHDVLFAAMARSPRPLRALCVMGYGENVGALRAEAHALRIDVTFIEPPGVSHAEVNRLMNQARVGVVCGVDDGAPAILTEYMLAGLPVVANADLVCGLQYIRPETGIAASAETFEHAILAAIDQSARFSPRATVLAEWSWPHSIKRLENLIAGSLTRGATIAAHPQGGSIEPTASV